VSKKLIPAVGEKKEGQAKGTAKKNREKKGKYSQQHSVRARPKRTYF